MYPGLGCYILDSMRHENKKLNKKNKGRKKIKTIVSESLKVV